MNIDFKFSEFFKLPTKIMCSICISTGLILFLPDNIIQMLYVTKFRNNYGFTIGIVFIISLSILLINFLISMYNVIRKKYSDITKRKNMHKTLLKLSGYQKKIVYELYIKDNHTIFLSIQDGSINELVALNILTRTTNCNITSAFNPKIPFTLQSWVIDKINNDSELLENFKLDYSIGTEKNII